MPVPRMRVLRALSAGALAVALAGGATAATAAAGFTAPASDVPALSTPHLAAAPAAAKKVVTKVTTTANLNLRAGSSTKHKVIRTIPKGKTVNVSATASNGWYKVSYAGKTGWISNKYTKVAASTAPKQPAPKGASTVKLWVTASANVNIRKGSSTGHASVGTLPKNSVAKATERAANGWYKISYKNKTGWVSNKYVKTCSKGCQVDTGDYTTNRAGLSDRYFTKANGSDLYAAVGGTRRVGDIPKNSIVYRDLKWEKEGGQVAGWYFVRTQGLNGWMKASDLKRSSNAGTTNSKGYTRAQVLRQSNGKVSSSMLAAVPWDKEKTLIAAPAVKDLTRLNTAFKKQFGKNLDIDLAYRTLDTQKYLYAELGSYIAAKPGTSNHGWGLAIDVPETYDYSFRGKYYKWLKANSHKYNWTHRKNLEEYRSDGSKNPYAEAWHFEYTGK